MYNDYFGFRETPFNITPDPRYFYTNPIYQEAYATLLYGVRERKGFIVLTGEVGTGKTTLLRRLINNPEGNVRLVFFYNTTLSFEELVSFACDELGLPVKGFGRLQKIQALNEFLIAQSKKGGTVVLLVDEAQNLTDDVLENLRLLSNLETASEKLLQIVLVGQTELDAKLNQPQLRQIKQRVALHCRLDRLKDREISPFVNYRLRTAGYEGEDLFTADAIREVASYSKGIPRVINIICDNALLIGYATSATQISADVIREVANDLGIDSEMKVSTFEPSAVKAAAKNRETEKEKRINVRREEEIPRQPRNLRPMLMGSAGLLVLVMLIAGAMAYRAELKSWITVVTSNKLDPAKNQTAARRKSFNDSGLEDRSEESSNVGATVASAQQAEAALTPEVQKKDQERAERLSAVPIQNSSETTKSPAVQGDSSVVIESGSTISRIVTETYGGAKVLLAMDILKEFNPSIQDLNWVVAGQNLSLPPLSRETLLRRQSDGSYHIILDSFFNAQEAAKLSQAVRLKGYTVAVTPRKVSDNLLVYRVEIRGLKNVEAANQAWKVATASRWIAVTDSAAYKENP